MLWLPHLNCDEPNFVWVYKPFAMGYYIRRGSVLLILLHSINVRGSKCCFHPNYNSYMRQHKKHALQFSHECN